MSRRQNKLSADCICEISFSLWWHVKDPFVDPNMVYVFDNYFGVFGEATHLAMLKTILRVGLIVIEAWFRGY